MDKLHVRLTPSESEGGPEPGTTYVVTDVLRSTSNIVLALDAGAAGVYPFDSAYSLELFRRTLPAGSYRVAHEQDCVRQEGAHLGNAVADFGAETVAGKHVLLLTSNGSPLLKALEGAEHLLALSFLNLSAVADHLHALPGRAVVACAGWKGGFALEDGLCAGALASALRIRNPSLELTEGAESARRLYETHARDLPGALASTEAAQRLGRLGFAADVAFCSRIDAVPLLPAGSGMPLRLQPYGRPAAAVVIDPDADEGERPDELPETGAPGAGPAPAGGAAGHEGDGTGEEEAGDGPPGTGGGPEGAAAPGEEPGGGSMSLGDHLVELRRKVFFSLVIVFAAFVVVFYESQLVVDFLLVPIDRAFDNVAEEDVLREAEQKGEKPPEGAELERRVQLRKGSLIAFKPEEVFLGYLKVSLLVAVFLSSPLWMWQLWSFVAAGLYPRERRYVYFFAPAVYLFFTAGVLFLYFLVLPLGLGFLLGFGEHPLLTRTVAFGSYMNFCLLLSVLMGLVFQTPLVMLFLSLVGLVSPDTFARKRKHVILGTFVLAAVITPPDVVTQVLVATPLMGLYELGIVLARVVPARAGRCRA